MKQQSFKYDFKYLQKEFEPEHTDAQKHYLSYEDIDK